MFGTSKPIIGMCHLKALPGDPSYQMEKGIDYIINEAAHDISILQDEGIDGILISNEFSYPYQQKVSQITVATIARVIGELRKDIRVPFGVDCMYDSHATIDLSIATGADFYRITLKPMSISDLELGNTALSDIFRCTSRNMSSSAKCIINTDHAIRQYSTPESLELILRAVKLQLSPSVICMSADSITNLYGSIHIISKDAGDELIIMCDGGCNERNVGEIIMRTNGIIVGKALKEDQELKNPVSQLNVRTFLHSARHGKLIN